MEEKILIKSEQHNIKKVFAIMIVIGIVLSLIAFLISIISNMNFYDSIYELYSEHRAQGYCIRGSWDPYCSRCEIVRENPSKFKFAIAETFESDSIFCIMPVVILTLIGLVIYLWLNSGELVITNKRIYGKIAWGKRVDLPIDSISATETIRILKGISVSTSSGKISFLAIKNAEKIYTIINNLLIERQ